jgi:thioredoxin reductase (NADPH)
MSSPTGIRRPAGIPQALPVAVAITRAADGKVLYANDRLAAGRPGTLGQAARLGLDRDPFLFETSVPGIFAVGDVRHGPGKRVAAAGLTAA